VLLAENDGVKQQAGQARDLTSSAVILIFVFLLVLVYLSGENIADFQFKTCKRRSSGSQNSPNYTP